MARINATLKHGLTNSMTVDLPEGTTVGSVKRNPVYSVQLRLPENTVAVVNGITVSENHVIEEGDEVVFERQAASKA